MVDEKRKFSKDREGDLLYGKQLQMYEKPNILREGGRLFVGGGDHGVGNKNGLAISNTKSPAIGWPCC